MEDQPISVTSSLSDGHCNICGSFIDTKPGEPSLVALLYSSVLKIQLDSDPSSALQKFCTNCSATLKELGEVEGQIRSLTALVSDLQERLLTTVISQLVNACVDIGYAVCANKNNKRHEIGKCAKMLGTTSTGYRVYKKWRSRFTASFLTKTKNSQTEAVDPKPQLLEGNSEVTQFLTDHDYSAMPTLNLKISEFRSPSSTVVQDEPTVVPALGNYACAECNRSFSRKVSLEAHIKKSHVTKDNRTESGVVCPICRIQYETEEEMQNHVNRDHPDVNCEKCDTCSAFYTIRNTGDEEGILSHECLQSSAKSDNSDDDQLNQTDKSKIRISKLKRNSVRRNQKTVSKIKASDLQGRKPQKYACQTCNKQFSTRTQLSIHSKIHTGEKPFICETCGQPFSSLASLHSHRKTHTGIKPYKCLSCPKTFRSTSHLAKHAIIHSGLKPFSCTVCEKSFNRRENLKTHQLTHEQMRPFQCPKCPLKAFTRPSLLRNHEIEFHSHLAKSAPAPEKQIPQPEPAEKQIAQAEPEELSNLQLQPLEIIQDSATLVGNVISYVQEAVLVAEDGGQYIIFNQVPNM